MRYGESLPSDLRRDGEVPVYGSNGRVGTHSTSLTQAPAIIVGRKGSQGRLQWSGRRVFPIDTTYFIDRSSTSHHLRWLFYALQPLALDSLTQDVGVPGLSREQAYSKRLRVPPPREQRAIADFLDAESARIDALMQKKAREKALLSGRLRAECDRAMRDLQPLVQLRHIISRLTSGPRGWAQHYVERGAQFITVASLQRNDIELDLSKTSSVDPPSGTEAFRVSVHRGDVLMSITADIGSVGVARNDGGFVSQHIALMTPRGCASDWLAYAIFSPSAQAQLDSLTYGGTKVQLALEDVAAIRVPVPPAHVQEEHVARLERSRGLILNAITRIEAQMDLLRERRRALITAAVTGEMEVPGVAAA